MDLLSPAPGLLIWTCLSIAAIVLWIAAAISIMRSNFKDRGSKLAWILVIIAFPILGSLLYFAIGKPNRIPN